MRIKRKKIPAETNLGPNNIKINTSNIQKVKVNMTDLKETKEFLSFLFSLVYGISKSLEDGKFKPTEILNFTGAVRKLPSAVGGIENVPDEIKDITSAEIDELVKFIIEEFNLVDKAKEAKVESFIETAFAFAKSVVAWR